MIRVPRTRVAVSALCVLALAVSVRALQDRTVAVTGTITVAAQGKGTPPRNDAVVWLKPLDVPAAGAAGRAPAKLKMVQRDKMFTPHLLVVPVGSSVDFPNDDPFFHNVFSLYDGKRFDLGLYEAGTSRSVTFPRAGICWRVSFSGGTARASSATCRSVER